MTSQIAILWEPLYKSALRRFDKSGNVSKGLLRLEKSILLELSNKIRSEQITVLNSNKLYLKLNHTIESRSFTYNLKIVRIILRTRGTLRWLCFQFMQKVFSDSYEISRGKLFIRIITNWKIFKTEILNNLIISTTDPDNNIFEIQRYEFTHPNTKFEFGDSITYLLACDFSKNLDFGFGLDPNKKALKKSILGRLIIWDSNAVMNFIRQHESLSTEENVLKFLKNFPDFEKLFSSQTRLELKFHINAALTLDERAASGFSLPDVFNNVEIWYQRFIISANVWNIIDSTCSPYNDFVAGHWQFLEKIPTHRKLVYMKAPEEVNRVRFSQAVYLIGRADENWFHLLLDTLPRYLKLREIDVDIPILVRSDLPDTTIALIKSLIPRKLIFVTPSNLVSVEKLFFIAARSTVYDTKPTDGQNQVRFPKHTLKELQHWVLDALTDDSDIKLPKKIFIPRRAKYRNMINGNQLQHEIETFGFETVETNSSFYLKQYSYFSQAKHVVSPGGAVLANMVFMKPGSEVTLIRSWRDSDLLLWKKLAEACGVHFNEAVGIPTYYGRKALARQHSNYFVPVRRVRKLLKILD